MYIIQWLILSKFLGRKINETVHYTKEKEMNNVNAIALIETGVLSAEKMLELCEKATDNYNDDPRCSTVVRAFVRSWKSANPLASNQNLIDVVATSSKLVQAHTVCIIASEMSREEFEHGFEVLSCGGDLVFAAGVSGKYTQDEVFALGECFYNEHSIETFPRYWKAVVNADVLDADGLYKVAMRKDYQNAFAYAWVKIQEIAILVLSKNKLNAAQVMDICKQFDCFEVSVAAIKTGVLSDEQILSLERTARSASEDFWGSVIPLLRLDARTIPDLVALGEKANSDRLWPSITKVINSKKAIRA